MFRLLTVSYLATDCYGTLFDVQVPSGLYLPLQRLHGNAPGARLFHGAVIVDFPPEPVKTKQPFKSKDASTTPTEPQLTGNPKLITVGGISGSGSCSFVFLWMCFSLLFD